MMGSVLAGRSKVLLVLAVCLAVSACQQPPKGHGTAALSPPDAAPPVMAPAPASTARQATVNFFLAQAQQDKGLTALSVAGGTLWVLPQPALTQVDLRSVEPRRWDDRRQAFVRFGFTSEGAQKLASLSRRYPGKIMVITIERNIVGLLRLDTVLDKGIVDMPVGSEQQAIQIANAVAGSPG